MSAKQTLIGHVVNAKRFYDNTSIWFGFARPCDWTVAKLYSMKQGAVFTIPVPDLAHPEANVLKLTIDTLPTIVDIALPTGIQPIDTIITAMNIRIQALLGYASLVTNSGYDHIVISGHDLGANAKVEITQEVYGDPLGFATGAISQGYDSIPDVDILATELDNTVYLRKIDSKLFVKSDPSTQAQVIGTIAGPFDTTGGNTFTISINSIYDLPITLTVSVALSVDTAITEINAQFAADPNYGSAFAAVASKDESDHLVITSPTFGASSLITVSSGNVNVLGTPFGGNPTGSVTGTAGGAIKFRDTEWSPVDEADIYTEGARWVYLNTSLLYDAVPLIPFSQIGIFTSLVPAVGHELDTLLYPQTVQDWGFLEFIDNRKTIEREEDKKETVSIILEF